MIIATTKPFLNKYRCSANIEGKQYDFDGINRYEAKQKMWEKIHALQNKDRYQYKIEFKDNE